MADSTIKSQIQAATVFEAFFVPALFEQWTGPVLDTDAVREGDRFLDVACGTGALARAAVDRVGPSGSVTGVDVNPGMLTVAAQVAPHVTWKEAPAEALPFEDASFDVVASNFGLVFFDRTRAIGEMLRVLKPGGRLSFAVWDRVEHIPAYSILIALLQVKVSQQAADALRVPFSLGDTGMLKHVFDEAGIVCDIVTLQGTARYPSVSSWVLTDLKGWFPIVDVTVDMEASAALITEAELALHAFVQPNGAVVFPIGVHVASLVKP
jgi:SAM-dependent methyltransferase